VQFHPESIASEHGHQLLANFLKLAGMAPRRRNAQRKVA
jgi:anthranilate synthase component 2